MSKSAIELKPFEKADGQTISFMLKAKDKQALHLQAHQTTEDAAFDSEFNILA